MKIATVIAGSLLALAIPLVEATTIYKTVDNNGNIIFTDTRSKGQPGETVNLRPITSISPVPTYSPAPFSITAPKKASYSHLAITEPSHESTVRNPEIVTVRVAIKPRIQFGHIVRLRLNGDVVAESRQRPTFELKEVERGTHTLTAEIVNREQQVVRSVTNTIYVHRTIFTPEVSINPPGTLRSNGRGF